MPPMGRILWLSALLHVSAAPPFLTAPLGLPEGAKMKIGPAYSPIALKFPEHAPTTADPCAAPCGLKTCGTVADVACATLADAFGCSCDGCCRAAAPAPAATIEEPVGPNVELANRTHPGRGLEFATVPGRMTYSGGVTAVSCAIEPVSMNDGRPGGAPKGCAGAVLWSGPTDEGYCKGGGNEYPLWARCCVWDDDAKKCEKKPPPPPTGPPGSCWRFYVTCPAHPTYAQKWMQDWWGYKRENLDPTSRESSDVCMARNNRGWCGGIPADHHHNHYVGPACARNEHVSNGRCVACPPGTTSDGGDDPSEGKDTGCECASTVTLGPWGWKESCWAKTDSRGLPRRRSDWAKHLPSDWAKKQNQNTHYFNPANGELVVGACVDTIGDIVKQGTVFYDCAEIKKVTFLHTVSNPVTIGQSAFAYSGVEVVDVPPRATFKSDSFGGAAALQRLVFRDDSDYSALKFEAGAFRVSGFSGVGWRKEVLLCAPLTCASMPPSDSSACPT